MFYIEMNIDHGVVNPLYTLRTDLIGTWIKLTHPFQDENGVIIRDYVHYILDDNHYIVNPQDIIEGMKVHGKWHITHMFAAADTPMRNYLKDL